MRGQLRTNARRLTAAAIAFIAVSVALTLDAASAFGRIPPDRVDGPSSRGSGGGSSVTTGSPIWTYLVVAAAALVVGVVVTRAVPKLRIRPRMHAASAR